METEIFEDLDILCAAILELFDKMLTYELTITKLKKLIEDYENIFEQNNFTENLKLIIKQTLTSRNGWGFLFLKRNVKKYINEY